ncbi:MAG: exodeoxyribonuclease VII large subunit [Acidobacteriaceae bacterium]
MARKAKVNPAEEVSGQSAAQLGLSFLEMSAPEPAPAALQPPPRRIWTVQALVSEVRQQIESAYADVWVEGEISNLRAAPSGHLYFTLKDSDAQLPVVLFRRQSMLLRFRPQDGMAVLARGKVSIYENRGQMQLVAETLEPRGAGALQIAFEQLKARLADEGLFDADRKQPLPAFPRSVGVITSPTGAVIRDILNVISRRHAALNVLLYPATVQGEQAAAEVSAGIRWFNQQAAQGKPVADVLILARGGGSMEDLAPFNDELLARTIAASEIPIVSAIGHETDFTIADFVADLRAPTPSAAAELVTAAQHRIEEHIAQLEQRAARACRYQLLRARERYTRLSAEATFYRLQDSFGRRQQRIDEFRFRLENAWTVATAQRLQQLRAASERLLRQDVSRQLTQTRNRLDQLTQRLLYTPEKLLRTRIAAWQTAAAQLTSLSPLAVLNRGYALVFNAEGELVKSAEQAAAGETITARLAHGELRATILESRSDNKQTS